ncbi:hypothetical protein LCGC14_2056690 [marine sediment metagenome]|uniref:Uncharacterized protein n=1 Tax=marine sediment metagenome TaxID=412755 RepID=A0A0F9H0Y5_9ZZZZ
MQFYFKNEDNNHGDLDKVFDKALSMFVDLYDPSKKEINFKCPELIIESILLCSSKIMGFPDPMVCPVCKISYPKGTLECYTCKTGKLKDIPIKTVPIRFNIFAKNGFGEDGKTTLEAHEKEVIDKKKREQERIDKIQAKKDEYKTQKAKSDKLLNELRKIGPITDL